jgi:translation elongation factor EF-1alpha
VNIAIIGHQQGGKSSLFGWVRSRFEDLDLHKLKTQSQKQGLENAFYAWTSFSCKTEQKTGISVETSYFSAKSSKVLNFFDTPGSADFTSEVISSCFFCDVAVLVADGAIRKNIESKVVLPSKSQMYLARGCGINNLIIFLGKLDKAKNSQETTEETLVKLVNAAKDSGFKPENIRTIKGSLISGNLSNDLLSIIDSFNLHQKPSPDTWKPVRLAVEDKGKLVHGNLLGNWLAGYLLSGVLKTGAIVSFAQCGVSAKVKEIMKAGEKVEKAVCGDFVDVILVKIQGDFEKVLKGFIASSLNYDPVLTSRLRIRGITNDPFIPVLKNQNLILHIMNFKTLVVVSQVLRKVQGKEIVNKPRCLRGRTMGDIEVTFLVPRPVESFKTLLKLSRCVLTHQNSVVFAGMVTDLL